MRLRAINIYSAFLGDLEKTKERTALIRKESDFLYLEYYNVVRFCNNEFIKQLNVSCDENAKEIAVRERNSDGYSVITMPFDFSSYQTLSLEEKNAFWVEEIIKVFNFVLPLMKCESDKKIIDFIDYLKEKYIKR
ncbi:hypothetical protein [uncultured Clostridium sp.]|jgi:hypothetical protein|uniref:hypothetical protein n=1 Tax=uncultured Clostridium sp. TaxID=59620 RepID=UPI00272D7A95|nr:hypothetical protein [uncultured Clostridium sp.]